MKTRDNNGKSIISILIIRLLLIIAIYSFLRFSFYLINYSYFSNLRPKELANIFLTGIRFDLAAIFAVNLIVIVLQTIPFSFRFRKAYQVIVTIIFYVTNITAFVFNIIDIAYFRFSSKRSTAELLDFMANEGEVKGSMSSYFRDFWYLFALLLICVFVMIVIDREIRALKPTRPTAKKPAQNIVFFILFMFISFTFYRGGFQKRMLEISDAPKYTKSGTVVILLNTPFAIIRSIGTKNLKKIEYFPKAESDKIFTPLHSSTPADSLNRGKIKKNIVVIILEGFSSEYCSCMNKSVDHGTYKGFTPFLDSLCEKSFVFRCFSNSKHSIEGIPSVIASLPPLMNCPYVYSPYFKDTINALPSLLKGMGYYSAFFHGGNNGTMNLDDFAKAAGFDNYYGRKEYNNDKEFDGVWGINDEPFLQYVARTISKAPQPFFISVFTVSSHHPYNIPLKYKKQFQPGQLPIHQSIRYADYALGRFFQTIKNDPWYKNTIFLVVSDHSSETLSSYYKNRVGNYETPLLIFEPGKKLHGYSNIIAQQSDVLPTLLGMINYDKKYVAFGNDLFNKNSDHFSISYLDNTFQLIKDGYVLQFDGNESFALYDLKRDSLLNNNIVSLNTAKKEELERFLKAVIQNYNNRLIQNRLTAD